MAHNTPSAAGHPYRLRSSPSKLSTGKRSKPEEPSNGETAQGARFVVPLQLLESEAIRALGSHYVPDGNKSGRVVAGVIGIWQEFTDPAKIRGKLQEMGRTLAEEQVKEGRVVAEVWCRKIDRGADVTVILNMRIAQRKE